MLLLSVTMVVGVAVAFILPDWPSAKPSKLGFSKEELLLAQKRMAEDASAADEDLTGASFLHGFHLAIRDPVVWIFVLATFLQIMGLSYTNFFPTLVGTLGYGSIEVSFPNSRSDELELTSSSSPRLCCSPHHHGSGHHQSV